LAGFPPAAARNILDLRLLAPGVTTATTTKENTMLRKSHSLLAATLLTLSFTVAAQAPAKMTDGVLVDGKGMTLYTFDKDAGGKSMCNGPCATNWPPLMAGADAKAMGDWTVVTRDDGSKQWAYKGKPLYTWVKDTKPGDKTGDNVNNVWHVVK
jgi:predicted lipoprotein with Yx(FWY)xxD motif